MFKHFYTIFLLFIVTNEEIIKTKETPKPIILSRKKRVEPIEIVVASIVLFGSVVSGVASQIISEKRTHYQNKELEKISSVGGLYGKYFLPKLHIFQNEIHKYLHRHNLYKNDDILHIHDYITYFIEVCNSMYDINTLYEKNLKKKKMGPADIYYSIEAININMKSMFNWLYKTIIKMNEYSKTIKTIDQFLYSDMGYDLKIDNGDMFARYYFKYQPMYNKNYYTKIVKHMETRWNNVYIKIKDLVDITYKLFIVMTVINNKDYYKITGELSDFFGFNNPIDVYKVKYLYSVLDEFMNDDNYLYDEKYIHSFPFYKNLFSKIREYKKGENGGVESIKLLKENNFGAHIKSLIFNFFNIECDHNINEYILFYKILETFPILTTTTATTKTTKTSKRTESTTINYVNFKKNIENKLNKMFRKNTTISSSSTVLTSTSSTSTSTTSTSSTVSTSTSSTTPITTTLTFYHKDMRGAKIISSSFIFTSIFGTLLFLIIIKIRREYKKKKSNKVSVESQTNTLTKGDSRILVNGELYRINIVRSLAKYQNRISLPPMKYGEPISSL